MDGSPAPAEGLALYQHHAKSLSDLEKVMPRTDPRRTRAQMKVSQNALPFFDADGKRSEYPRGSEVFGLEGHSAGIPMQFIKALGSRLIDCGKTDG